MPPPANFLLHTVHPSVRPTHKTPIYSSACVRSLHCGKSRQTNRIRQREKATDCTRERSTATQTSRSCQSTRTCHCGSSLHPSIYYTLETERARNRVKVTEWLSLSNEGMRSCAIQVREARAYASRQKIKSDMPAETTTEMLREFRNSFYMRLATICAHVMKTNDISAPRTMW